MSSIAIYTLTSELHDPEAVAATTRELLDDLAIPCELRGEDYSDFGTHTLDLIYVCTGGTEGLFLRLLPCLLAKSRRPVHLLTSGKSNSLAASLEILTYLRQHGLQGEVLHGQPSFIARRISLLTRVEEVLSRLRGLRLGVIGAPSDWLIASAVDDDLIRRRMGIELVHIDIKEVNEGFASDSTLAKREDSKDKNLHSSTIPEGIEEGPNPLSPSSPSQLEVSHALRIYDSLRDIVSRHRLDGFTLRCFDLLSTLHTTGCLALAKLNAEGIVAGCEGDVPAMLSMAVANALTGLSGFQANPARIDPETGELLFAHCTIPLNMVERYELDTHFESGIGVGIRGFVKPGPVTLFKLAGNLQRHFIAEGQLIHCQAAPDLCRTQMVIRLSQPEQASYFLTDPIGNHHIIIPGHHRQLLEAVLTDFGTTAAC